MIQGTSSSAGKSILTAGLLRYFASNGIACSPFKSQNMSLNSFVTEDGFEIASSQAVQSEAAFKKPARQMNPILIKPSSDTEMHLIVEGKYFGNMNFRDYGAKKDFFLKKAADSFEFLAERNSLIVLEGAGSPAEINLFKYDIANMGFAEIYGIPVILSADIERGGVFASLYGTVKLLPPKWRKLVKGFIINKFRGNADILEPGIRQMEKRLKIPCLGVIPHIKNLHVEAEDSLNLKKIEKEKESGAGLELEISRLNIGIARLEHISNFNEFDPLFFDERLSARFFEEVPAGMGEFDMIIIPGSKSTIGDLNALKKSGVFGYIKRFEKAGGIIMGICGGFQMMGERIKDPHRIEGHSQGDTGDADGFGFFKIETEMSEEKILANKKYEFKFKNNGIPSFLKGYEIHNGRTFFSNDYSGGDINIAAHNTAFTAACGGLCPETGIMSEDNRKIGTYIHGLFVNEIFKNFTIELIIKNMEHTKKESYSNSNSWRTGSLRTYQTVKNEGFELLSGNIEKHLNIKLLKEIIGI